jgi:hypothetical protein
MTKFVAISFWKRKRYRWRIYLMNTEDGRRSVLNGDWRAVEFNSYSKVTHAIRYLESNQYGSYAEWKLIWKFRKLDNVASEKQKQRTHACSI